MKKNNSKTEKMTINYGKKQKALLRGLVACSIYLFILLSSLNASAQAMWQGGYGNQTGTPYDGYVINDDKSNFNTFLRFQYGTSSAFRINHEIGTMSFSYSDANNNFYDKGTEYVTLGSDGKFTIKKNGKQYATSLNVGGVDLYSDGLVSNHYQSTFKWYTGAVGSGVFKMGLNSDGKLGIGTENPAELLDVNGNIKAAGFKINGQSGFLKANGTVDNTAYLSLSGGTLTGDLIGTFKKPNGTSSQFLKADGSVDGSTYLTNASLSNYLPLSGGTVSNNINFPKTGAGITFGGGASKIFDNGDIHYYTDDNTYFETGSNNAPFLWKRGVGSSGVGGSTSMNLLGDNLTVTGHVTATQFKKLNGTSSQFLKADGSVDDRTFLTNAGGTLIGDLTGKFKTPNGKSSEFLKADGSVDRSTYLTNEGGTLTGDLTGTFKTENGTFSQFLKADGSVDSNNYLTAEQIGSYIPTNYLSLNGGIVDGNLTLNGNTKATNLVVGTPTNLASNTVATFGGIVQITPAGATPTTFDYKAYGSDYLLWVEKGIVTTDVAYTDLTDWADFVFDKEYELMPIQEVNQFIQTKGHLPNIPSEEEIKKDGFTAVDMTKKLLQKIEELTLYAIEQDKKIEALGKAIEQFKKN